MTNENNFTAYWVLVILLVIGFVGSLIYLGTDGFESRKNNIENDKFYDNYSLVSNDSSLWILGVKNVTRQEIVKVDEYCDEETESHYTILDICKAQDNDGDGYAVVNRNYYVDVFNLIIVNFPSGYSKDKTFRPGDTIWYEKNGIVIDPNAYTYVYLDQFKKIFYQYQVKEKIFEDSCFSKENVTKIVNIYEYCKAPSIILRSGKFYLINKTPLNIKVTNGHENCLDINEFNNTWKFMNVCNNDSLIIIDFSYKDCYDLDLDKDGFAKIIVEKCINRWVRERKIE